MGLTGRSHKHYSKLQQDDPDDESDGSAKVDADLGAEEGAEEAHGARPEDRDAGAEELPPVGHRLAIAFAGPLFNILFAISIYYFVYLMGVPTLAPVVGTVNDDSPALLAGLQTGDRILAIEDEEILYWEQLQKIVHESPGQS